MVFTGQVKVLLGIGAEVLKAEPFGSITVGFGLTVGPSIGIEHCSQLSRDGVSMAEPVVGQNRS